MMESEIENNYKISYRGEASAFIFDVRNSTATTLKALQKGKFDLHVSFMLEINCRLLASLHRHGAIGKFAFNDTGDGCLCVFYDENHAVTCLKVALELYQFIQILLECEGDMMIEELEIKPIEYSMALHSAEVTVGNISFKEPEINRNFSRNYFYGNVVNSAARLEAFSKNYIHDNFLMTAAFKDLAVRQNDLSGNEDKKKLLKYFQNMACLGEVNLNDHTTGGHWIYSLEQLSVDEILNFYNLHRHQRGGSR